MLEGILLPARSQYLMEGSGVRSNLSLQEQKLQEELYWKRYRNLYERIRINVTEKAAL